MNDGDARAVRHGVSPLTGFDFTKAWLAGEGEARQALPAAEELLKKRVEALGAPAGPCAWQKWAPEEVGELRDFNRAVGNQVGAALSKRLSREDALVVVTGQQPNLFVSPLYILYKALSARAWAEKLSRQLGRTVTPIFWVASDDDDFAELKQAWVPEWSGELRDLGRRLSRGEKLGSGVPAYRWDLGANRERLAADLNTALTGWPSGDQTAAWLTESIKIEPGFEQNFCRLLAQLLGPDNPMLFVAPRLKALRQRGATVLANDVMRHRDMNVTVTESAQHFSGKGNPVSLAREGEALNSFWLHEGRRCRLVRADAARVVALDPVTQKTVREFSDEALLSALKSHPEQFAPNVVTRPIVQDTALPTLLYVAGPGEMAYLAVLGAAYNALGCVRSAVVPRSFITLGAEAASGESSLVDEPEQVLQQEQIGRELLTELDGFLQDVQGRFSRLNAVAARSGAAVGAAVALTEEHVLRGVGQLKRRLARQVTTTAWQQQARMSSLLYPAGKPQERMLTPWIFVRPGAWDSLAKFLAERVDFTAAGPHELPLPDYAEDII